MGEEIEGKYIEPERGWNEDSALLELSLVLSLLVTVTAGASITV